MASDYENETRAMTLRVCEVFESLATVMNTAPRDWSTNPRDAWLYGVVVGWDDVIGDVAAQHHWDADTVERLQAMNATVKRF